MFSGVRLAGHSDTEISRFLDTIGRDSALSGWQMRQASDAIRILLCDMLEFSWACSFDWAGWKEGTIELERGHRTVMREYEAPPALELELSGRRLASRAEIATAYGSLIDNAMAELRRLDYAASTEKSYLGGIRLFLSVTGVKPCTELCTNDVERFLSYLALVRKVSPSSQSLALNAVNFLFTKILDKSLEEELAFVRPKRGRRMPVVFSPDEVRCLLMQLSSTNQLRIGLMYGTGMRLMECVRLRVQDVDFDYHQILVRDGKGKKDRVVPLRASYSDALREHLARVKELHEQDVADGCDGVFLPGALSRKYPNAAKEWGWQYVFPASRLSVDPRSGLKRRHHIHESSLQKAIKRAGIAAGLSKRVNCHGMRHSFATHLLENGYDIRTVQELLGHADVSTTMIYTHVMNKPGLAVKSPADLL